MKRFYKNVAVAENDGGFSVVLDGRPIRTPAKAPLGLPTLQLADAIAREWREQGEKVDPAAMPMMRFASTAIDRVAGRREEVVDEVTAYGSSDLVCYRAEEPEELAGLQERAWQPLLDWLERRHGVRFRVTAGIIHVTQEADALATLRTVVATYDHWTLTALHAAASAAGSLVVALALLEREISAEQAWQASQVDEAFQAEKWGQDSDATQRRWSLRSNLENAALFHALSRACVAGADGT